MDTSLVDHAHPHYRLIFKASGPDQNFVVEGKVAPLQSDTLIAVDSWQQHANVHRQGAERTLFLALYIEPGWPADGIEALSIAPSPAFFRVRGFRSRAKSIGSARGSWGGWRTLPTGMTSFSN
jgi:AraC family transcriptional regulator